MAKLNYKNGVTSVILRVKIMDTASTTGGGKTGLTEASSGMIIATIADNEATTTRYRASSSEIETISTLGTFATPTSSKCRFKEVDATNHAGLYEIQITDARWAVSNARSVIVTVSGASGAASVDTEVQLEPVPANTTQILATALTETSSGYLSAAFKKFLDVATPVLTTAMVNQTGDCYVRLPAALVGGRMDSSVGAMASAVLTAAAIAADAITAAKIADGAIDAATFAANALDAVWSTTTRLLTGGNNIVLAKGTGLTGLNDLSAAQVNTEVAGALATYDAPTHTELTAELAGLLTTVLTESYAATGAAPTLTQAIMLMYQRYTTFARTANKISIKKLDGSTQAAELTLNAGSPPFTSSARSA